MVNLGRNVEAVVLACCFFRRFDAKDDLSGEKKNPSVAGHVYGGSIPETAGRCKKTQASSDRRSKLVLR